jgi:hypothetical protein
VAEGAEVGGQPGHSEILSQKKKKKEIHVKT